MTVEQIEQLIIDSGVKAIAEGFQEAIDEFREVISLEAITQTNDCIEILTNSLCSKEEFRKLEKLNDTFLEMIQDKRLYLNE